jgi:hypothetical protein
MTYEELNNLYVTEIEKWLTRCGYKASAHVKDIIRSVIMARDEVNPYAGHFAQAIVNNDLRGVITRGDDECLDNLRLIYAAFYNIDTWHIKVTFNQGSLTLETVENE